MQDVLNARKKPLKVISTNDIHFDPEKIGLNGSPTQVMKIFAPPPRPSGKIVDGRENPEKAVEEMLDFLVKKKFLKEDFSC